MQGKPNIIMLNFMRCLMTSVTLAGCASTGTPAVNESVQRIDLSQTKQMSQVIIKFRDPTLDSARRDVLLKEIARDAGVRLSYVRPMSGGAYVLRVDGVMNADHLLRVVDRIKKAPEVEDAEPDRRMHHMPHN